MAVEEIKQKYIHVPTDEMFSLAECVKENMNNCESWKCTHKDRYSIRREPLTTTDAWKEQFDLHYGDMDFMFPENLYKADIILNEIDLCIDSIRARNPRFFENFPICHIERNDNYKKTGMYKGSETITGEVKTYLESGGTITYTHSVYTDGEISSAKMDEENEGAINITVKDFTVFVFCTEAVFENTAYFNGTHKERLATMIV